MQNLCLVIDFGIRAATSHFAPLEEKLLYVLCLGWMQRLWPLQEGLLAQKLIFEFSDGLVALEELLPVGKERINHVLTNFSKEFLQLTKQQECNISNVASALRWWQCTSKASDETLAICGLLNFNTLELVNLPPEQCMQTFFLCIQKLPSHIIFLSGVKLNDVGFHWAPKTLMLCLEFSLNFSEYKAFCTSIGLMAEYIVVYFQDKDFDGEFECCIHDLTQQCIYKVTNLWLGIEAMEAVTSYSCNTILLLEWPKPLVVTSCAIVLVQGVVLRKLGDERDRISCEFKKIASKGNH
jgi:hypothetical protein